MDWPTWLPRPKLPTLKALSTNSALDPLLYAWLACPLIAMAASWPTDKTFLYCTLSIWGLLTISIVGAFFYFAFNDPDRLAPPSHQRYMAKLLADERRSIGLTIDGVITSNPAAASGKAIAHVK